MAEEGAFVSNCGENTNCEQAKENEKKASESNFEKGLFEDTGVMTDFDTAAVFVPKGFTEKGYTEMCEIKKSAKASGISLICVATSSLLLGIIIAIVLRNSGINLDQIEKILSSTAFNALIQVFFTTLAFVICFAGVFKLNKIYISELISFKNPEKGTFLPFFLIGFAFCAFANMATSFSGWIFDLLGIDYNVTQNESPEGFFGFMISTLSVAVLPALAEEFACRGLIMGSLKKYGNGFAVMVSSILFGILHGNFQQMPFAFLVGLAVGYAVIKTGSIWTGIIIHFANNFLSVGLDYGLENADIVVKNIIITLLFTTMLLFGMVGLFILKKRNIDFDFEKTQTDISEKEKYKCFFTGATVIIAISLFVLESFLYF